jgi:undecaprenyl-diphosphatase
MRDTQKTRQMPVAKKLSQFRHRVDVAGDEAVLMKASGFNTFMARVDAAEYGICRKLNRGASFAFPRRVFRIASRLGDGIIWYVLLAVLPLLYGAAGVKPAIIMALTGALGVALYKLLKRVFVRERPFITHSTIDLAMAPLDRYSFPSGHTLHAVSFAWQATAFFPELGWVLVPLAALIASSRVVLGLHYPTDVLAGAAIGASLATLGCSLA